MLEKYIIELHRKDQKIKELKRMLAESNATAKRLRHLLRIARIALRKTYEKK